MFTGRKPQILRNRAQAQILDFLRSRQLSAIKKAGASAPPPITVPIGVFSDRHKTIDGR